MTDRIESQIERFAPGFRDVVLARSTATAALTEAHNPNYVGGAITGGAGTLRQTIFRPVAQWNPYRTGMDGIYLCSASAPPGGGVHGMCGDGAARAAAARSRSVRRRLASMPAEMPPPAQDQGAHSFAAACSTFAASVVFASTASS